MRTSPSRAGAGRMLLLPACLALVLTGCGRGRSTEDWAAALQAQDATTRLHATHALAQATTESAIAVPALIGALKDPNAYVRRDAAEALAGFGPRAREAVPALRALSEDKNKSVRRAAARTLAVVQ